MAKSPTNAGRAGSGRSRTAKRKSILKPKKEAETPVHQEKSRETGARRGSLLGEVENPFQNRTVEPLSEAHSSDADSSADEKNVEEKLAGIPDEIEASSTFAQTKDEQPQDETELLMTRAAQVISREHVDAAVRSIFLQLDKHFGTDHWELSPLEGSLVSSPLTEMLRYGWVTCSKWLPSLLVLQCENVPGLAGFLLGCGIVFVPRAKKQMQLNIARGLKPLSFAKGKATDAEESAGDGQSAPTASGRVA